LEKHRSGAADEAYLFAGNRRGAPLNLDNLAARVIKPSTEKCMECEKPRSKHKSAEDHRFELESRLVWKRWHAFRRGLASDLYSPGVALKVIQAILRHGDIGTTLAYYVQVPNEESREALQVFESAFPFGL
jgi:hypothetical protein